MSIHDRIEDATQQLETDVDLTHQVVHGDENTVVDTEGGGVPSHAKVAKDSNIEIIALLEPTVSDINEHAAFVEEKANEAGSSATAAASSETNAATSATEAAGSASAAATSEDNAAASETAAAGSATAAATSETNAATSATSAKEEADRAKAEADKAEGIADGLAQFQPGMTMPWPGLFEKIPDGWMHVNGQTLNIADQPNLFDVLGTTWGGDGETTFALPPADRFPFMAGATFPIGDTGGASSATTSESGSHSHSVTIDSAGDHSHSVTVDSAGDHSHTVTVNATTLTTDHLPSHAHNFTRPSYDTNGSYNGGANWNIYNEFKYGDPTVTVDASGGSAAHTHTASSSSTGSHSHSASSGSTGNHSHDASTASTGNHTHTVDTVPPYAAMAYIIKL